MTKHTTLMLLCAFFAFASHLHGAEPKKTRLSKVHKKQKKLDEIENMLIATAYLFEHDQYNPALQETLVNLAKDSTNAKKRLIQYQNNTKPKHKKAHHD